MASSLLRNERIRIKDGDGAAITGRESSANPRQITYHAAAHVEITSSDNVLEVAPICTRLHLIIECIVQTRNHPIRYRRRSISIDNV
jgi:hypothetical protein